MKVAKKDHFNVYVDVTMIYDVLRKVYCDQN